MDGGETEKFSIEVRFGLQAMARDKMSQAYRLEIGLPSARIDLALPSHRYLTLTCCLCARFILLPVCPICTKDIPSPARGGVAKDTVSPLFGKEELGEI